MKAQFRLEDELRVDFQSYTIPFPQKKSCPVPILGQSKKIYPVLF